MKEWLKDFFYNFDEVTGIVVIICFANFSLVMLYFIHCIYCLLGGGN